MDQVVSKQSLRPGQFPQRGNQVPNPRYLTKYWMQAVFRESLVHGSASFPGGEAAATLTLYMWPAPNLYTVRTLAT